MMKKTMLIAGALFTFATTSAVMAEQAPAAPQAAPAPAPTNFSDADLQKFADVQTKLESIRDEYSSKLESATEQEAAQSLQQEASQAMIKAIEEQGMDIEVYSQIAQAVRTDDALRQKIIGMIQ